VFTVQVGASAAARAFVVRELPVERRTVRNVTCVDLPPSLGSFDAGTCMLQFHF